MTWGQAMLDGRSRTQPGIAHAEAERGFGARFDASRWLVAILVTLALAVCIAAAPASAAQAQQQPAVIVQTAFDRSHATVGDPIGLTITIRYAAGVQVNTSGIESQFGDFEALSEDPPVTHTNSDGTSALRLSYHVAAYKTGALQFPALKLTYTASGQQASASSQPLPFTIDSVIPPGDPATDIRGLKPQIELQAPAATIAWREIGIAAGAGLAALLLALLFWQFVRRERLQAAPVLAPAPPPLEAEARAELDRICADGLLANGDYRTHYARMAECIRRYVARRYGFAATALTTAELQERMVQCGVGRWRARLVSGLLSECDAVHYAHYLPAPARAEADLEMAYEVIDLSWSQETRPEETVLEFVRRN